MKTKIDFPFPRELKLVSEYEAAKQLHLVDAVGRLSNNDYASGAMVMHELLSCPNSEYVSGAMDMFTILTNKGN
jgi:hypothetical protein